MMDLKNLPNARENEKIEILLRRHWFALLAIFGAVAMLLVIPGTITFFFMDQIQLWLNDPVYAPIIVMVASAYFMSVWLFAFLEFTDYHLDVWIVTNERILNIEQKGLFDRTASQLHLISVQDVTSEVTGILHTFFDYGDVHIQTAGERARFHFKNIPNPEGVKRKVVALVEADKQRHGHQRSTTRA